MRSLAFPAVVVLPFVLACSSSSDAPAAVACADVELIAAASDYQNSSICAVPGRTFSGTDLGTDPQLAMTGGRALFIARDLDLIFELDPHCATPLSKFSVHDLAPVTSSGTRGLANPHGIAAAPDGTAIVTLFSAAKVAFVKNGVVESSLDLSSYDDDGNPNPESVVVVDVGGTSKAFVALEHLDDRDAQLKPNKGAQLLRIDVASRSIDGVFDLKGWNPFNAMAELDGALFLAEPRDFDRADEDEAGIERFDTATSSSRILVSEKDLGGSVAEIAITNGCGVAIVAGPERNVNPTSVVTFDPETGAVLASIATPLLATEGYDLQGLAWRGDTLYVGDRRSGAGGYPIHVFERDAGTCTLHPSSRTLTLPAKPVALRTTPAAR